MKSSTYKEIIDLIEQLPKNQQIGLLASLSLLEEREEAIMATKKSINTTSAEEWDALRNKVWDAPTGTEALNVIKEIPKGWVPEKEDVMEVKKPRFTPEQWDKINELSDAQVAEAREFEKYIKENWEEPSEDFMVNPLDKQVGGSHYAAMKIQPVEFITANELGFLEGNVVKYICRHHAKNGAEDIKKAIHYCELLLQTKYGEN